MRHKPRANSVSETPLAVQNDHSFAWSPVASISVVSRSYARDRIESTTSNTTDLKASRKQDRRRTKRGKSRHKGSQEIFDVQWESDVKVDKCGLCKSDFSLVRRKHHCRHCGRIMCSDCSSFLYFELSRRKHRVCSTCNNQLLAEQDAYERETMIAGDATSNLFADSSDGGQVKTLSRTLMFNDDDEKAKRKQEENLRKNQREKIQNQELAAKSPITARNHANSVEKNLIMNGAEVVDDADKDWFTDVPDQQTHSRDSVDVYSEDGGLKESGWRDRLKDSYKVMPATKETSGFAPTAGMTDKSSISDPFRYDVNKSGRGHDDISIKLPRPKQQIVASTVVDRSAKPSGLSGNGYFSEHFRYDDVGGPGLGHDDDRSIAMPRPKQQVVTTPYNYKNERDIQKRPGPNSADGSTSHEQDFQARSTCTDMFSGSKSREVLAKRTEKKAQASSSRGQDNQNMTLDELNLSYSSQDESNTLAPTVHYLTPSQPTLYDHDVHELAVDVPPGYFEATMEEREAQHKKEEEQYEQFARNTAWANNSLLSTTVQPHRISSEQDSYSIINPSSHTSNSPDSYQRGDARGTGQSEKAKSGFTGVLKRFFGMGLKKTTTPSKPAKIPSKPTKTPRAAVVAPPETNIAEDYTSPVSDGNHFDSTSTTDSGGLLRHSVVDYSGANREEPVSEANFRNTMTARVDLTSRAKVSLPLQGGELTQQHQKQEAERKRRGTFDELFMSPKANVAIDDFSDQFSTKGGSQWFARVEENTTVGLTSFGAVGVARFDQRRPVDNAEEVVRDNGTLSVVASSQRAGDVTEACRESAAMLLLNDKKDTTEAEESGFTWSNIGSSASGLGTATYTVPTSLQSRAIYSDVIGTTGKNEASATLGGIMDDLKYGSASNKKLQSKESVDDFFAEFEETNDYIYDSTIGGYVAARASKRIVATRVEQLKSREMLVPEKVDSRTSGHGYNDPFSIADNGKVVEDDVAEVIVDKISSLECELAALKQLIRTRNGSGENQSSKPRASRRTAKPSVRKESIFDNSSSDEDTDKTASYVSLTRPVVERGSKQRPGSKKMYSRTRKDSFADLFEDSPNKDKVMGGAASFDDLFQTEEKLIEISKANVSDDDANRVQSPTNRATNLRRSRSKTNSFVHSNDSDSEPELTSIKTRRGKLSSRRTHEDVNKSSPHMNEGTFATLPSRVDANLKRANKQTEEDDSIDALFDISIDRDATTLYGGDDSDDGENTHSVFESNPVPVMEGKTLLFSPKSSSDAESSGSLVTIAADMEFVTPVSEVNPSYSYSLDSQGLAGEENLSINWSKMRKARSRKQKGPAFSNAVVEGNTTNGATKGIFLEPSLSSESSEFTKIEISPEHAAILADASSNWMSVGALDGEKVSVSVTDGGFKSQPVYERNSMTQSAAEAVVVNEKKQDDRVDVSLAAANPAPVVAAPNAKANEVVLSGEVDNAVLANLGLIKESVDTNVKVLRQDATTFDIFDKSGDMEYSQASSPLGLKVPDQEDIANDSANDDKESFFGNDEAFSFELQAPKKRFSGNVAPTVSRAKSMSKYSDSPRSSTSADDGVELGKYATLPVPPLSRTPSIDSNCNDPEDTMVDDNSVLGKVELQAFDTNWQRMQAEEKERRKRLQVKQRQAQRDKLLRKHGASTKSLSGRTATPGSSKSKQKSGKKKKKAKEKDDATSSSSHHKKSGSSRKTRRDAIGNAVLTPSEPPRLLTEL